MAVELRTITATTPATAGRPALVRHARALAALGVAWHAIEAAVAVLAGLAASSIALIGFGADSLVEATAGIVVLWRFAAGRASSQAAEQRAQRVIALTFFAIAAYVAAEATRALIGGHEPKASWVGIALAAFTAVAMPPLAIAKAHVAARLGSSATRSEGRQNMLCAYLSLGLLVGLGANALLGWWWADPVTALAIAAIAIREGRDAWRGDNPCCAPLTGSAASARASDCACCS